MLHVPNRAFEADGFAAAQLQRYARLQDVGVVTCEYNIQPPNIASQRFHDTFGFREVGTQWLADGVKQVSLRAAEI